MTNPPSISQSIAAAWPLASWRDVNVVLAVSGGADSVALLCAMHQLKTDGAGELRVAHLNHGLRAEQSDADEQFVRALCDKLNVPACVGRADVSTAAGVAGDGLEAAARQARYEFLRKTASGFGARYVATGHTADDQAETILHHILRGTGIAGLSGMPAARELADSVTLIRPLLGVRREDVIGYLAQRGQSFREDASNQDLRFTRNRLRHDLLPKLRADYNPAVDQALLRLGALASDAQAVVDDAVGELYDEAVANNNGSILVSCRAMRGRSRYLIRELFIRVWRDNNFPLQGMGWEEWESLAAMICADDDAAAAPRDFPGGIRAEKKGEQFVLTRP